MVKKETVLSGFETEIALVIRKNAEDIIEDVAGLTSILGYDLKPAESLRIRDSYFDTKEGDFRGRMVSLRVRKFDGVQLFSMKSDPKKLIGSGVRRREVELPWSYRSVHRLASELRLKPSVRMAARFSSLTVSEALSELGLEIIQERVTFRRTRKIALRNRPTSTLAELALDHVTYLDEAVKVRLFELEIETKAPRALATIRRIAEALESNYPDSLARWEHGKFATGLAIRRLLSVGRLQPILDQDRLTPEAFLLIDQAIRSGGHL